MATGRHRSGNGTIIERTSEGVAALTMPAMITERSCMLRSGSPFSAFVGREWASYPLIARFAKM